MRLFHLVVALIAVLIANSALAASLAGRLGLTGKAGALVPLQDSFVSSTSETRTGITAGGGLIYGITRSLAVEVDMTHSPQLDVEISGSKAYEAVLNDVAIGVQYRLFPDDRLVPFVGGGADFIKGSLKHAVTGAPYNLDWTEGGHLNFGLDFFLAKGIAFSTEGRFLFGFDGDVKSGGTKVGTYDPTSFIGTVGFRLIIPQRAF
ncbi:MAG TPA: outer membrane beta-barrel protein [Geomonas sp.]|nr:outer membrane beta-barrel protein [Geomonas sp.]